MADQGGDAGGTEAAAPAEGAAAAPGLDLSPITEQLGEVMSRLDQFGAQMPQPQQAPEQDPWDFGDLYGDQQQEAQPDYGLEQAQPQVDFQQLVQRMAEASKTQSQSQIESAIAPLMEHMANLQADTDAATLIEAIPELADEQVAEATVKQADQMAAALGLDPRVARSAGFIETVWKAQRYEQVARGEVPVGDLTHDALETGGGAQPQARPEADIAQAIKAAGGHNTFWGT